MLFNRRGFIQAGVAAAAIPTWATAKTRDGGASFFDGTALAKNELAARFKPFDMALPDVPVMTAQGPANLAGVGGKVRLLSLWAEWCVPCLVEIRDFAELRPRFANDRFDIGLLMTASKLDRSQALARLKPLGAQAMPLLVESGFRAAEQLAVRPDAPLIAGQKKSGFSLPCTLLVDAHGKVRARSFGAPTSMTLPAPAEPKAAVKPGAPVVSRSRILTQADKDALLADGKTIWSAASGAEFLAALSGGIVDGM